MQDSTVLMNNLKPLRRRVALSVRCKVAMKNFSKILSKDFQKLLRFTSDGKHDRMTTMLINFGNLQKSCTANVRRVMNISKICDKNFETDFRLDFERCLLIAVQYS